MTKLSFATQTVLDAFRSCHTGQGCLAAALRAIANQGEIFFDEYDSPVEVVTIDDLLTIAKELEAQ